MSAVHALLLAASLCSGADLDRGAALYDAGDYVQAASVFKALVAERPRDPHLHYDLGNALFKQGRVGPAVASYLRAFELDPRDSDIRFNLEFALRKAGEELVPAGTPGPVFTLFHLLAGHEITGLHWLACWLTLVLGGLALLKPALRERLRPAILAAAAAWALFGAWWGLRESAAPDAPGVIVAPLAELRSGPAERFSVTFTAPEGRRVDVLGETAGWVEIGVLAEGARGWLPASAVERL